MEEVVLEEPLDVFAAVDCSPVRPGAVDEVEEGEVGDSMMMLCLVSRSCSCLLSLHVFPLFLLLFLLLSPLLSSLSLISFQSLPLLFLLRVKLTEVPSLKAL